MPMYELTCERARLEPPSPQMVRLRAALQGNQEAANRFTGVIYGTVPVAEFFAPENIQRIIAGAESTAAAAG